MSMRNYLIAAAVVALGLGAAPANSQEPYVVCSSPGVIKVLNNILGLGGPGTITPAPDSAAGRLDSQQVGVYHCVVDMMDGKEVRRTQSYTVSLLDNNRFYVQTPPAPREQLMYFENGHVVYR